MEEYNMGIKIPDLLIVAGLFIVLCFVVYFLIIAPIINDKKLKRYYQDLLEYIKVNQGNYLAICKYIDETPKPPDTMDFSFLLYTTVRDEAHSELNKVYTNYLLDLLENTSLTPLERLEKFDESVTTVDFIFEDIEYYPETEEVLERYLTDVCILAVKTLIKNNDKLEGYTKEELQSVKDDIVFVLDIINDDDFCVTSYHQSTLTSELNELYNKVVLIQNAEYIESK